MIFGVFFRDFWISSRLRGDLSVRAGSFIRRLENFIFPVLRVKIPEVRGELQRATFILSDFDAGEIRMVGLERLELPTKRL